MKKKKNLWQAIMLLTFLVVLPLGSWIYMKKGYEYQKAAMNELKDYGRLSPFLATDYFNRNFGSDQIKESLVLLNYYNDTPAADSRMETVAKLHEQFDDRQGVIFLNIGMASNSKLEREYAELDSSQVYMIPASEREPFFLGRDVMMPTNPAAIQVDSLEFQDIDAGSLTDFNYFVLVDTKGNIRNYYDADEGQRIKRLVEHIALAMPREKKAKTESIPKKL